MANNRDVGPLPLRTVLTAHEVVATGRAGNVLQVPSPIYTAIFVDAHHALIGAGGGGRRFGMPNIALLLRVQSLKKASTADLTTTPAAASMAPVAAAPSVWSFAAAVDLGPDDIPWCTSSFLPFEASWNDEKARGGVCTEPAALDWTHAQRRVLDGLVGFVALSSIASFSLLGVYRGTEPSTSQAKESSASTVASVRAGNSADAESHRYLRQLARIEVPSDAKNPDKKPIALVQNVVLVSHDEKGVLMFALTDLVPDSFEDEDVDAYTIRYADQMASGAAGTVLQRRVPRVRTDAVPMASWQLTGRVNDLSVNRVCIVQADVGDGASSLSSKPCKAHLQEHLVLAALLLNKTVVLSTVRLRRHYTRSRRPKPSLVQGVETIAVQTPTESKSTATAATSVGTALTLTEDLLPLPFKLLTSSLRLVRLFGWGDIDAAQQADMRRRLTWQSLQAGGAATHGRLCSIVMVAYNSLANESYLIHGAVEVTPLVPSASSSATNSTADLSLKVLWAQKDSVPVLSDAITSLAVCTDRPSAEYAARAAANPLGAAVPTHWIAGTVEGWIASLRLSQDCGQTHCWRADQIRPSLNKAVARRYPALHKDPISCVAVSSENDVVSADIAQNVVLTTLPYAVPCGPSSWTTAPSSKTSNSDVVVQPRSISSSPLFPPPGAASGGLLGILTSELAHIQWSLHVRWFLLIPLVLVVTGVITSMRA